MKHLEHLRGMYEEIDGTSLVERILEREGKAEAVEWLKKIERKKKEKRRTKDDERGLCNTSSNQ